jgi:hypothetical protein
MNHLPVSSKTVEVPFRLALITGKIAYCSGTSIVFGVFD